MFSLNKKSTLLLIGILIILRIVWFFSSKMDKNSPVSKVAQKASNIIRGDDGFAFDETTPGYETYLGLIQGCSFKDCIPSIDDPEFETVDVADKWLEDSDTVFVLDYKGEVRAYSQRVMNRHEIVNDLIAGDPLVITFCPLCGSALAFERTLDGTVYEFGVSGKLHDNDLVMYDRQTESLWQQITGEVIVGELFGTRLKQISFGVMTWDEAKERFPNLMSLKRVGATATYNYYPYGDYEDDPNPLFPMDVDSTIHPKAVVFGVELEGNFKAYPEEKLKEGSNEIRDEVGGVNIWINYNNGDVSVRRVDTGEEIPATRLFWFAWKAFRPETELY
jgi:hypothetical protein